MAKYYEQNRKRQPKQLKEMIKQQCIKLNVLLQEASTTKGIDAEPEMQDTTNQDKGIKQTYIFIRVTIDGPEQTETKILFNAGELSRRREQRVE